MANVGSVMFSVAFAGMLAAGSVFVGCVGDDTDPEGGGGTGGGSASGGTGGSGGTPAPTGPSCPSVATVSGTTPLLTDFEAMASATATYTFDAGLLGGTYIYSDTMSVPPSTAVLSFAEGHDATSTKALVGNISNATWGGGMGLWFACHDASVYKGITFWARGSIPVGTVKLNLTINEIEVESKGGTCPEAGPCTRPFVDMELTETWTQHTFAWGDFMPGSAAGTAVPGSGAALFGIEWSFTNDNMAHDFELAIDDFAFTTE